MTQLEEDRRRHALELATRLVAAREHSGRTMLGTETLAREVIETAERFAKYLRGEDEAP